MAKVVINYEGTKSYYDDNGFYHREDGPALIYPDGNREYYLHAKMLSDITGPDVDQSGMRYFFRTSDDNIVEIHSDFHPALQEPNGYKRWVLHGTIIWPELR